MAARSVADVPTFVVVGAGLAGAKAVETLRAEGFDGRLVLVGHEDELPYERPPLSKDYLQGKAERDSVFVHDVDWYREHDVELRLGSEAVRLDRVGHEVELAGLERVPYDRLLLTTGSRPRRLDVPGAELDGVHYLRSLGDSERIRATIASARRLVVVGAGWIGLEVTAAARRADVEVVLLETAELPLLRVLGREMATVFADLHRAHGVDLRTGVQVAEVTGDGARATGVRLSDGSVVEGDAVLVGVGIAPNVELAADAGLAVDDGIVVDAFLRTSDPDVFAAGDVASAEHPLLGRRIRVEHWANALNQPQAAARAMLGQDVAYDRVPYFYSDQYDLGMEYSGWVGREDVDRVAVRGDRDGREFVAFWQDAEGRVLAGMNVNVWDVTDPIQALVRSRQPVDPGRLSDPAVPLDELLG
jgi:3-phenylpropionate/trans-cinnamate dioxygenase ferredoxin reductase subunit